MKRSSQWFALLLIGAAGAICLSAQPDEAPERKTKDRKAYVTRQGSSFLGIGVSEIDAERVKALNLKEERGVEVTSVEENGPGAKAGLKQGDVVLEYNGERIQGIEQFVRLVRETPAGRQVRLLVWRNGGAITLTPTIESRPARFSFHGPDGESFSFNFPEIPPIPPIPPMPDVPTGNMSWRSSSLGIESEALTPQLAQYFGVKEGVLVRSVNPDSPAAKAGIKAGDVITKVAGTAIARPHDISNAVRSQRGKNSVSFVVVREKRELTLTVAMADESRMRGLRRLTWAPKQC